MTTWFTSDTHWNHANIIKYCDRPFTDLDDMNEGLIERWNARVQPGDDVYHTGDFAFDNTRNKIQFDEITARLNGNIHLIAGNHDVKCINKFVGCFASVQSYSEVTIDGQFIVLFHYAMRVWNRSHHGSWQLYGHSHGTLPDDPNSLSIDIGVDSHNYAPISFEEVREIMSRKTFQPLDHHGG